MSYSSFTTADLKEKFGVEQIFKSDLISADKPVKVSDLTRNFIFTNLEFAISQRTEKAKSEYIIAPVFAELRQQAKEKISVFSGVKFDVDRKLNLKGYCDFLVSRSPYQALLEAPVMVAVEAKKDDFDTGYNQCIAEMIAARIFNKNKNIEVDEIYGCVTTGTIWQFIILNGQKAFIDTKSFSIEDDLEEIVGILLAMALDNISK
jgi:hypothetical protein